MALERKEVEIVCGLQPKLSRRPFEDQRAEFFEAKSGGSFHPATQRCVTGGPDRRNGHVQSSFLAYTKSANALGCVDARRTQTVVDDHKPDGERESATDGGTNGATLSDELAGDAVEREQKDNVAGKEDRVERVVNI